MSQTALWTMFALLVGAIFVVDLMFVQGKSEERPTFKKSVLVTAFYASLAIFFGIWTYRFMGAEQGMQFFAAYVVEQSLSMDNLFVFILIFASFKVPQHLQRRVLFWGVVGAILMRAFFIFFGIELLHRIHWMIYVFGATLVFAGLKSLFSKEEAEENVEKPRYLKAIKRVTEGFHGQDFFVKQGGKLFATPLFLTLISIEVSDVIFAVDSIPAVLSISNDPFIVYSSNIFAIMGLRSLFFVISDLMKYLRFLNYGLGIILIFVGCKMLVSNHIVIPISISLLTILGILVLTFIASYFFKQDSAKTGAH